MRQICLLFAGKARRECETKPENRIDRGGSVRHFHKMQTVTSITVIRRLVNKWRRVGIRIGFVPTMGYLHDGHLALFKTARRLAGKAGRVVVSIYVNPAQFGPNEDFSKYPRDLKRDLQLCADEGVDIVFAPVDREMYPDKSAGACSTYVVEEKLSQAMEGASRPAHFKGVTTVVAKLFNIVQPDLAVFGQKDFQQAAIIQRMVRDLNFPVAIVVAPTVREDDGLAMSSRNKYLSGDLRRQATALWRAILRAQSAVKKSGNPVSSARLKSDLKKFIEREPDARLDYVEFFKPETLEPVERVSEGAHMALAVFVGRTRLIDNARL